MPGVTTAAELQPYTGERIVRVLATDLHRRAYRCNWNQLKANYGDNVDFQLLHEQVLLCEETKGYMYSAFPPTRTKYRRGSRPELERVVDTAVKGCASERDRALQLMRFCRDLYKKFHGQLLFYGGTEEELVKKGEQLCETLARLMTALCEIAGIPARIIMHVVGGHVVNEVYLEGAWAYIDPRVGLYYVHDDGRFASTEDLRQNPHLLSRQAEAVKRDISARWTWDERERRNKEALFHRNEIFVIKNYSLADSGRFNYEWRTNEELVRSGIHAIARQYREYAGRLFDSGTGPSPRLLLSLQDGQTVRGRIPLIAMAQHYVIPPLEVTFRIDGEIVFSTEREVPKENIHTYVKGMYTCFGDGKLWDTTTVAAGKHVIEAFADGCPEDGCAVCVEVAR